MKFFRNRTFLGVLCVLIAIVICFVVAPYINDSKSSTVEIPRIVSDIKAGQLIESGMVETVEVGGFNLSDNVIRDENEIVGKYAITDLFAGDYLTAEKISETRTDENPYLYELDGTKRAISLTLQSFACGLSGKLLPGDIVSVIVPEYDGGSATVVPPELQYVRVLAVTDDDGNDSEAEYAAESGDEEEKLPSTVTLLVLPEQAEVIAKVESDNEPHLALVYRGNDENAEKFLAAQEEIIRESEEEPLTNITENIDESEENTDETVLQTEE